ncbi:Predicted permease [Haloechinothrix alba]|uniref:Predicted permease n=1 Tax=Haloechinothrix alba TaxID=664784 RepID=A0A238X0C7_9PSEU|nr:permease [Haloechinothrix alba]SNR52316.1 Predicted permease [Haloechinothrix alba]
MALLFVVAAGLALGTPFYVSTEAFLPIASALHDSGMSLGATVALVLTSAGVNLPEPTVLSRLMRAGLLACYTLTVVVAAIGAGYLVPLLAP